VNIALVNEMIRFSHELDIDLWNAIDCAETKPFGFMAFRPGPGVGGHCIPVDPSYLSHRVKAVLGYAFRMVELAEEVNSAAPHYVVDRVAAELNRRRLSVNGARILLLGITYKPNVADLRETPAEPIATRLLELGADVQFHDPFVSTWNLGGRRLETVVDPYTAASAADQVVLLQPHATYDLVELANTGARVFDSCGAMVPGGHIVRL
jgi:UDP-N-acetyl-D-glucosamine dehydrogenase